MGQPQDKESGWQETQLPDFTLPLVDMAEMDKPVMVVTVTDMRMMSHVRAVGKGHCFTPVPPSLPQESYHPQGVCVMTGPAPQSSPR